MKLFTSDTVFPSENGSQQVRHNPLCALSAELVVMLADESITQLMGE